MKKIQDIKKGRPIPIKIISTNFKPLDGRTHYGKRIKQVAKVLDFGAYIISCAAIALMITYTLALWTA